MDRLFRRFVVLVIVVVGHVLLVLLIASRHASEVGEQLSARSTRPVLLLLEAEPRSEPQRKNPEPTRERQRRRDVPRDKPAAATSISKDSDAAASGAANGTPQVDWDNEAQVTIKAMAPRVAREMERKCADAKRLGEARPAGCKKDSYEPHWEAEPGRVGTIGLFPFVRVGKRCIVGLGFFGCAGGKQEADGTLLDDMRDPNRPHSSVPDIDPDNGLAELPPPVVMIEK